MASTRRLGLLNLASTARRIEILCPDARSARDRSPSCAGSGPKVGATQRAGFTLGFSAARALTPELKTASPIIAAPAVPWRAGSCRSNLLVRLQVASFYEGAVAWLQLCRPALPAALWAWLGTANWRGLLLPDLSRRLNPGAGTEQDRHHPQISRA